jgi:hypothetical protein
MEVQGQDGHLLWGCLYDLNNQTNENDGHYGVEVKCGDIKFYGGVDWDEKDGFGVSVFALIGCWHQSII